MRVRRRWLGLLMAIALGGCAKSCSRTAGPVAAREDLALAPKETNFTVMANLARMRGTGMWRKVLDLRDSDAEAKRSYDEFVQKCAFDPTKQLDSVFVAFPQRSDNRDFVAVARGTFDEAKLVACAQDQAKNDGSSITPSENKSTKHETD